MVILLGMMTQIMMVVKINLEQRQYKDLINNKEIK